MEFCPLLIGLAASPRIFKKVQAEMVSFLHLQGILLMPYLDDHLLYATTEKKIKEDLQIVIFNLEKLRQIINKEK